MEGLQDQLRTQHGVVGHSGPGVIPDAPPTEASPPDSTYPPSRGRSSRWRPTPSS